MSTPAPEPSIAPDGIESAGFDPTPPGAGEAPARHWWGRHLREVRWEAELARLLVDPIYYGRGVPHGDGMPVLTIPGFLAGDPSQWVLWDWLRRIGYSPHASGIRFNVGCSDRALERLDSRLERIHWDTGRKVALVGASRGGHFAKALAHRRPERVAAVVSLGSALDTPFDISIPTRAAVVAVREAHRRTTDRFARNGCLTTTCRCRFTRDFAGTFPKEVPLTSVYSKGDGVVWWESCVVPYANCVEVTGSHVGMGSNRKSYRVIAEALAAAGTRSAPGLDAAPAAAEPSG